MTAHAMKGDADKCIEHGMNDYISKPIDARRLLELVEDWGGSSASIEQAAVADENNDLRATNDSREGLSTACHKVKTADFEVALQRLDGNVQLLRDMIGFFREDTPDLLDQIDGGVQQSDARTVKRAAP